MRNAIVVGMLAITCSVLTSSCSFFESNFNLACEDIVKERLLAPSAYKRISITRSDQILTRAEYASYMVSADRPQSVVKANLKSFDDGSYKPKKLRAFVEYDAPNAYGTPIRGTSVCEDVSDSGKDESTRSIYTIVAKVDGYSQTEWVLKRLKESQQ